MKKREIIRPAVWIGFTAFGALLAASFLSLKVVHFLFIGCVISCLIMLITKLYRTHPNALILFITSAFFLGYYAITYQLQVVPYEQYANGKYTVQAEILSLPEENNGNFYYKAHIYAIDDPPISVDFNIRLSHREALPVEIDDTIRCTVKFYDFGSERGLSSKSSNLAKGIVLGGYITDDTFNVNESEKHRLDFYLTGLRTYLEKKIVSALPLEEASVLSAMLLGIRDTISDTLNDHYRNSGASHVLVISGMHMSILVQFSLNALVYIGIRRRYAILLTYPTMILFMAVSGFSASVLRSGIMQIIWLTGLLIGRKADSLNSLAIAALLLLLFNPFAIGDISLLLSFSATLGMITLSPRMMEFCTRRIQDKKRRRITLQLTSPVVSSASAILGTLPVQLYVFGTVNLLSIVTSLLILYASAWIIRLGLPTVLLLGIPYLSQMASPLLLITGLLVRYQNFITRLISESFPKPMYVSGAYVQGTVLIVVLFLLISRWIAGEKTLPVTVYILSALIFLGAAAANFLISRSETRLLVMNSRYAQCVAVVQNAEAAILSCSGNATDISDFLRHHNAESIDLLLVGDEESEIRCAEKLSSQFDVEKTLIPDSVYFPSTENSSVYHYGTSAQLFTDTPVSVSAYGNSIHFELCGKLITVDTENACYLEEQTDVLITDRIDGPVTAPLTVLLTDDLFSDLETILNTGDYLLTNEHESLRLAFKLDGSYSIRNG